MFHADGRSDMTKLTVAFRNFPNAPKNPKFTDTTRPSNCRTRKVKQCTSVLAGRTLPAHIHRIRRTASHEIQAGESAHATHSDC